MAEQKKRPRERDSERLRKLSTYLEDRATRRVSDEQTTRYMKLKEDVDSQIASLAANSSNQSPQPPFPISSRMQYNVPYGTSSQYHVPNQNINFHFSNLTPNQSQAQEQRQQPTPAAEDPWRKEDYDAMFNKKTDSQKSNPDTIVSNQNITETTNVEEEVKPPRPQAHAQPGNPMLPVILPNQGVPPPRPPDEDKNENTKKEKEIGKATLGFFILASLLLIYVDYYSPAFPAPYTGFTLSLNFTWENSKDLFLGFVALPLFLSLLVGYFLKEVLHKKVSLFLLGAVVLSGNLIPKFWEAITLGGFSSDTLNRVIIIGFILLVIFIQWKRGGGIQTFSFKDITFVLFSLALSFVFYYIDWKSADQRAYIHFILILLFVFMIIKKTEESETDVYLWGAALLLLDFYGLKFLNEISDLIKYVPFLTLAILYYCDSRLKSRVAGWAMWAVLALSVSLVLTQASVDPYPGLQGTQNTDGATQDERAKGLLDTLKGATNTFIKSRLDQAIYSGQVEKNLYESLGVYFSGLKAAQPIFYRNEPVIIWGTIRSKTYQDMVLIKASCAKTKEGKLDIEGEMIPSKPFPIFQLEETDIQCTVKPGSLAEGSNTITLTAEYNFATNAYQRAYFIDVNRYRSLGAEGAKTPEDVLRKLGVKDKAPKAKSTNGPVEIGVGISPLTTVSQVENPLTLPRISISLDNREQIEDKDKRVITRWEGTIKGIKELVLLVPSGVTIPDPTACTPAQFKPYDSTDCRLSCTGKGTIGGDDQNSLICTEVCGSSASCLSECRLTVQRCIDDCDFLFNDEKSQGKKYTAYALDVSRVFAYDYKDNRYRTFSCNFQATPEVLQNSPFTTRDFRIRARYDYILENNVQVAVQTPLPTPETAEGGVLREYGPIKTASSKSNNPDLLSAIAMVETGLRHCCASGSGTNVRCQKIDLPNCPPSQTISSSTDLRTKSVGMMQINVRTWEKKAAEVCGKKPDGSPFTLYDLECNLKMGDFILADYLNRYGKMEDERWKSLIERYCKDSSHRARYLSYKTPIERALRGYNGLGCGTNSDPGYVEKVIAANSRVKEGKITSIDISRYFTTREGEGMQPETMAEQPEAPSSVTARYDEGTKEVIITFESTATNTSLRRRKTRIPFSALSRSARLRYPAKRQLSRGYAK